MEKEAEARGNRRVKWRRKWQRWGKQMWEKEERCEVSWKIKEGIGSMQGRLLTFISPLCLAARGSKCSQPHLIHDSKEGQPSQLGSPVTAVPCSSPTTKFRGEPVTHFCSGRRQKRSAVKLLQNVSPLWRKCRMRWPLLCLWLASHLELMLGAAPAILQPQGKLHWQGQAGRDGRTLGSKISHFFLWQ